MNSNRFVWFLAAIPLLLGAMATESAFGQAGATLNVSFRDEIAPILAAKCMRCHGEEQADGDFRIDEQSSLEAYIEKGDPENSELYDRIASTEEDYRMPPDLGDQLAQHEQRLIYEWITLGPNYQKVDDWKTVQFKGTDLAEADTLGKAVWALLGRFHPAVIHFPIALLTVAAFLAVFGFGNAYTDKAAVYCLVLGTLGSIVAAASGWGFAEYRKWPPSELSFGGQNQMIQQAESAEETADESGDEEDQPTAETQEADGGDGRRMLSEEEAEALGGEQVDPADGMLNVEQFTLIPGDERSLHRWGGVAVAVLGIVVTLLAFYVRNRPENSQFIWKLSSVVLAGLVGWVGHQGGEIHYGNDLYDGPLNRISQLMDSNAATADEEIEATLDANEAAKENAGPDPAPADDTTAAEEDDAAGSASAEVEEGDDEDGAEDGDAADDDDDASESTESDDQ